MSRTPENDGHERLKIVYATAFDVTAPNGPGVNEREFILAMSKSGKLHSASVPQPANDLGDLSAIKQVGFLSPTAAGPFGLMVVNQIAMVRALTDQVAAAKAFGYLPIVVVRMPWLPWSLVRLKQRHPELPLFLKSVGLVHELPRYKGLKQVVSRSLLPSHEALVRKVVRRADGLDAPTPQLARFLADRFEIPQEKSVCIPNATNTDRFDPANFENGPARPGHVIGYIGGHPYERGGREILHALARLRERFPDLSGLIVGGDAELLNREAERLGVSDICEIPGQVPYEQVGDYFSRLDILLATDRQERAGTFGNSNQKIRQALAMRVPVITNPNCEQLLLDEGVVRGIDTTDAEAVEREIVRLLEMPRAALVDLKDHCRRVAVEHYSTAATLNQRVAFWNSRIAASKLAQ